MPTCPGGHDSESTDFCDVCGIRMNGPAQAPAPAAAGPAPGRSCPRCGAETTGQFCEACGYSVASGAGRPDTAPSYAATAGWTAVVTADRAYFDRVVAASSPDVAAVEFPAYCPQRQFRLSGPEMRIGRRSASRGLEPEIDLTGPPLDPGVSHLHAVLIAEPDGGWTVLDPGSANGTQVNGREIAAGARVRLQDGDRVGVGAWTVLTIQAD